MFLQNPNYRQKDSILTPDFYGYIFLSENKKSFYILNQENFLMNTRRRAYMRDMNLLVIYDTPHVFTDEEEFFETIEDKILGKIVSKKRLQELNLEEIAQSLIEDKFIALRAHTQTSKDKTKFEIKYEFKKLN